MPPGLRAPRDLILQGDLHQARRPGLRSRDLQTRTDLRGQAGDGVEVGEGEHEGVEKRGVERRERRPGGITPGRDRRGVVVLRHTHRLPDPVIHLRERALRGERVVEVEDDRAGTLCRGRDLRAPGDLQGVARTAPPAAGVEGHGPCTRRLRGGEQAAGDLRDLGHLDALGPDDARHGVVEAGTEHEHRGVRDAVGETGDVVVRRIRIAAAALPRRGEVGELVVGVDVGVQLLQLLLRGHLPLDAADPELGPELLFLQLLRCLLITHVGQPSCAAAYTWGW